MKKEVTKGMSEDLRVKAGDNLTKADIDNFVEETKKWIGREIELDQADKFLAEQPVEASEIRRFALLNRDPNPLFTDRNYAKNTRWKNVIAPTIFMQTSYQTEVFGTVPVQLPGVLQAQHWLHSGIGLELFQPIQPGDIIQPKVYFDNIEVKHGNFVGQMFLNSTKTICKNQREQVIGIQKHYDMLYSVHKAQSKNTYGNISKLQAYPPLERSDLGRWTINRQGAKLRYFEDVNIGDELPPINYEFYVMDIVAQAAAIRTGIDYPQERGGIGCHWHYHPETCFQVRGLPLPFDYGQMRYTWASRLLTDWAGDNAWVWKMYLQARKPIFAGDVTKVKGKIINKYAADDRHCVDIDVWYENQRNENSVKGTCTVILPSNKNPNSPILPEAPII
ncbi:MaoC family dehydratase N-terminal domain-containing protein [Chloroflexota bacterium]